MKSFYVGVKGIVFFEDNILFLKRVRSDTYYWDSPGGRVDGDEELVDALTRELREEIGVENVNIQDKLTFYKLPNDVENEHGLLLVYYKAEVHTDTVKISDEHEAYKWVKKNDLSKFIDDEKDHMNDGMKKAVRHAIDL